MPLRVYSVQIWPALPHPDSTAGQATELLSNTIVEADPMVIIMVSSLELGVAANVAWRQAEIEASVAAVASAEARNEAIAGATDAAAAASGSSSSAGSGKRRAPTTSGPSIVDAAAAASAVSGRSRMQPPKLWSPIESERVCPSWDAVAADAKFLKGGGAGTPPLDMAASVAVPAGSLPSHRDTVQQASASARAGVGAGAGVRAGVVATPEGSVLDPAALTEGLSASGGGSSSAAAAAGALTREAQAAGELALLDVDGDEGGVGPAGLGAGALLSGPGNPVVLCRGDSMGVLRLSNVPTADDLVAAEAARMDAEAESEAEASGVGAAAAGGTTEARSAPGVRSRSDASAAGTAGAGGTGATPAGRLPSVMHLGVAGGTAGVLAGIGGPGSVGGGLLSASSPWLGQAGALPSPTDPWVRLRAVPTSALESRPKRWTDAATLRRVERECVHAADVTGTRETLAVALDVRVSSSALTTECNGWSGGWAKGVKGFPVLVDGQLAPVLARRVRVLPHEQVPVIDVMHFM
jgi:hypothetical protein